MKRLQLCDKCGADREAKTGCGHIFRLEHHQSIVELYCQDCCYDTETYKRTYKDAVKTLEPRV